MTKDIAAANKGRHVKETTQAKVVQKKKVKEGLAYLIEDALEKSEVVLAAKSIVEKLQGMAEDLATMEAKDIMPLFDALTGTFGPQVAQKFNATATEQVRQLVSAMQNAKASLDGEILRLEQGVEGGDVNDLSMDAGAAPMMPSGQPPAPGGEPGMPPAEGGLVDQPPADMGADVIPGEVGPAIGREKKESVAPKGKLIRSKRVAEDIDMPMTPPDPLEVLHPGAAKIARNIGNMIGSEKLTAQQHAALQKVLDHIISVANDARYWAGKSADKTIDMLLEAENIWEIDTPALKKIAEQMKHLAHILKGKHDGILESNIRMLRKAPDPDALVLKTFRTKLAEDRDGQMAAIRTARMFAIDIEDVVAVVKEAAARRPFRAKLKEFKADINPAKKGMFKDDSIADLQKQRSTLKKKSAAAQERGDKVPADVQTKEREVNFAIRGKRHWKGGVDEAAPIMANQQPPPQQAQQSTELGQDIPMFPVEQGAPVQAAVQTAPPNADPVQPKEYFPSGSADDMAKLGLGDAVRSNQSRSTTKPLDPADMRARQAQQQMNAQTAQQQQTPVKPTQPANAPRSTVPQKRPWQQKGTG